MLKILKSIKDALLGPSYIDRMIAVEMDMIRWTNNEIQLDLAMNRKIDEKIKSRRLK
jgi:hypothetical protein